MEGITETALVAGADVVARDSVSAATIDAKLLLETANKLGKGVYIPHGRYDTLSSISVVYARRWRKRNVSQHDSTLYIEEPKFGKKRMGVLEIVGVLIEHGYLLRG